MWEDDYYYDDGSATTGGSDTVTPQNPGGPIIGGGGILDQYSGNNAFDADGNFAPADNFTVTDSGDIYSAAGDYLGNVNMGVTIVEITSPASGTLAGWLSGLFGSVGNALGGKTGATSGGGSGGGSSFGGGSSGSSSTKTSGSTAAGSGAPAALGQPSTKTANTYPINAADIAAAQSAQNLGLILPLSLVAIVAIFALKKSA